MAQEKPRFYDNPMRSYQATSAIAVRCAFFAAASLLLITGNLPAQERQPREGAKVRDGQENWLRGQTEQFEESDNPFLREQWFMHGRTLDHGDAAEYRLRAYQQKLYLRALNRMRTGMADSSASILRPQAALPSPAWTNLGPVPLNSDYSGFGNQDYGLVAGRVAAIAVDPNDATGNTVYAGAAYGGVWKTTNGTAIPSSVTWMPIMDSQATLAVGAIAVQPGNSNVILVGTGEPHQSGDSYYGLGILRSTDGGITWTLATQSSDATPYPFRGMGVSKIAFSTDNPSLVVAAMNTVTNGSSLGATISFSGRGIEYSTDAGATWHLGNVNDAGVPITPIQSATDVVYSPQTHLFYAAIRYHGIYSSSDGINFVKLAAQPGTISSLNCPAATVTTCPFYRAHIALHPAKNEMYVWFIDGSSNDQGIYQSTDSGATWKAISTAELDSGCGDGSRCGTTAQGLYDLYLAAVPDGNATDLYAGAINIYKCQVSATNPDCKSAPAGTNWFNLTHVYSCNPLSSLAHVHPDQHSIDFVRSNPSIIYFSNDGGVYRTLNGPGLNSGSCSASLPFDNLNTNLGSITQFYTLAGHPTDPTAFVGGTQDNGTAGVSSAASGANGTSWAEVTGGDGASVAIDPTNGNNVYVAITNAVQVYFSSSGVGSHSPQFGPAIINTNTVSGDKSDWVAPFKLDPADPTKIIIGTCRVWRGPSNGVGWTSANAISNNFGTHDTSSCLSSALTTVTTIRTLAVGGPKTANGSQVIYAGTEYGHVFATMNADAGPSAWTDVAVSIVGTCNQGTYPQCGYPISGLALDPRDSTGKSVYATVMGFGVAHVLKSTDGGLTWTNIGGGLPDAPADAIAVDPVNPAIVYVGTDVGVFVTQNNGQVWAEYGTGFPNTEVVAFDIFNNGTTHLLRAATHGRGAWSTTLASSVQASGTLTASPSFMTFLNQAVGTTGTQTVTVTASQAPVTISSMVPPAPPFVLGVNGCLPPVGGSPVTLQPGSSCTVEVRYTPTTSGGQTSSVSFNSNAAANPLSVSLQGNGVVTGGSGVTPETGWWWDSSLNGTGFFIEYRPAGTGGQANAGIFVGGFIYDSAGNATWIITLPFNGVGSFTSSASGLSYSGNWLRCTNGQTLTGTWKQNACSVYAPVTINFTSSTSATMTRPDGTTINLTRFSFSGTKTPQVGSPQSGWWWIDPSSPTYNFNNQGGTGYGIEIQGNAAFIVAYVYDGTTGNPIWNLTTSGSTPMTSPTTYSGTWQLFTGVPHWCTSASPACTPDGTYNTNSTNVTPVTINFSDATHGTMTMGTTVIPITKFNNF